MLTPSRYLADQKWLSARNDNHGGNFERRLKNTIDNISRFPWQDFRARAEILIVSYNELEEVTPVHASLGFGEDHWHDLGAAIHFVIVPAAFHNATENPLGLTMQQYRAKNIGLRRACGRHLVVTNADCLFPHQVLQQIIHLTVGREPPGQGSEGGQASGRSSHAASLAAAGVGGRQQGGVHWYSPGAG